MMRETPPQDFITSPEPHRVRRFANRTGREIVITPGDGWKGEHLIRAPKRAEPEMPIIAVPIRRPRGPKVPKQATGQTCAVPGCGRVLALQNVRGVCHLHVHRRAFCQCNRCQGKPEKIKAGERR